MLLIKDSKMSDESRIIVLTQLCNNASSTVLHFSVISLRVENEYYFSLNNNTSPLHVMRSYFPRESFQEMIVDS